MPPLCGIGVDDGNAFTLAFVARADAPPTTAAASTAPASASASRVLLNVNNFIRVTPGETK